MDIYTIYLSFNIYVTLCYLIIKWNEIDNFFFFSKSHFSFIQIIFYRLVMSFKTSKKDQIDQHSLYYISYQNKMSPLKSIFLRRALLKIWMTSFVFIFYIKYIVHGISNSLNTFADQNTLSFIRYTLLNFSSSEALMST